MKLTAREGYIIKLHLFLLVMHINVLGASNINNSVMDNIQNSETREDSVKNVARDKETLQSTLSMRSSDIIVDGDRDQNLANGSCINIEKKGESWLQVDLGDMYTVFNIRVFLADPGDDLEDCFEQPWTYRGNANTTESGFPCQPWNITHDIFNIMPPDFLGFRIGENNCRSTNIDYFPWCHTSYHFLPENFKKMCDIQLRNQKVWCYTTNPELEWENCVVKKCVKASTSNVILKIGTTESNIETPEFMDNSGLSENILEFVLHNNPQARYVEIHQDYTTDYFPLCEVEVYGISNDTINAALHKPAKLSSVYGDFGPHLAVDGIRTKRSYFATEKELNPWWRVDLSGIYVVFLIRLFNRLDCCKDEAHDVLLQLGKSLDTMYNASFVDGQIDDIHTIILPVDTKARFVQIVRTGGNNESFHLYEVEVLGKLAECQPNFCENDGQCSVRYCFGYSCRSYLCTCADGYGGVNCEFRTYNVAIGKQIQLSSNQFENWKTNNVIDEDDNQNVLEGATCVSTKREVKPYLIIDLGGEFNVTNVEVYPRSDCCPDNTKDIDLYLMISSSWINTGDTDDSIQSKVAFLIHPHATTRYIKIVATEDKPVYLQICDIKVHAIYQEGRSTNTSDPISAPVTRQEKKPYIQMRFSLSDEYSNVVTSEASFINSIKQGLSLQTGYSIGSFKEMQVERDPFRVSLQLHSNDDWNVTLDEKFDKIDTLIRFGILEIENEDGKLLTITAGSLQHHVMYKGNKGTKPDSTILQMVILFAVGIYSFLE